MVGRVAVDPSDTGGVVGASSRLMPASGASHVHPATAAYPGATSTGQQEPGQPGHHGDHSGAGACLALLGAAFALAVVLRARAVPTGSHGGGGPNVRLHPRAWCRISSPPSLSSLCVLRT
jgi:hypothetical protein